MKHIIQIFIVGILYIFSMQLTSANFTGDTILQTVENSKESCVLYTNNSIFCTEKSTQITTQVYDFPHDTTFLKVVLLTNGNVYGVNEEGKIFEGKKQYSQQKSATKEIKQKKVKKVRKNKKPEIKLNGETVEQIEQGEKYIDLGAVWDDREDGTGIVLAKNILKKDSETNTYKRYTGNISTNKVGVNYRLQYFYTDTRNQQSQTLTRFVSIMDRIKEDPYIGSQNSCNSYHLVCEENIFGEKTWKLNKGSFCVGKMMDKIGKLCEAPKEGKIDTTRDSYNGKDNLTEMVFDLDERKQRNPFGDRKLQDIEEYFYEEEAVFIEKMEVVLQKTDTDEFTIVSDLNKKLVTKIIGRVNSISEEQKVDYLLALYEDLETDGKTLSNKEFQTYFTYFKYQIAKEALSV